MDRYIGVIQNILKYSKEEEWFEFKENWFDAQGIGEYISALFFQAEDGIRDQWM